MKFIKEEPIGRGSCYIYEDEIWFISVWHVYRRRWEFHILNNKDKRFLNSGHFKTMKQAIAEIKFLMENWL